jgi:hypothetical protein
MVASEARAKPKAAAAGKSRVLRYSGVLHGQGGAPVGGIYRLEFSLYGSKEGKKAAWTEQHWVAVEAGSYSVDLGKVVPIGDKVPVDNAFIGVTLPGAGEILREKLVVAGVPRPSEPAPPPEPPGAKSGRPTAGQPGEAPAPTAGGVIEYAEKAGFAYEAEHASNASKAFGLTLEELSKQVARPAKVGATSRDTETAGGKGGYEFELNCPKGYVVTGMKGAAGIYIDAVQLICSPLE